MIGDIEKANDFWWIDNIWVAFAYISFCYVFGPYLIWHIVYFTMLLKYVFTIERSSPQQHRRQGANYQDGSMMTEHKFQVYFAMLWSALIVGVFFFHLNAREDDDTIELAGHVNCPWSIASMINNLILIIWKAWTKIRKLHNTNDPNHSQQNPRYTCAYILCHSTSF